MGLTETSPFKTPRCYACLGPTLRSKHQIKPCFFFSIRFFLIFSLNRLSPPCARTILWDDVCDGMPPPVRDLSLIPLRLVQTLLRIKGDIREEAAQTLSNEFETTGVVSRGWRPEQRQCITVICGLTSECSPQPAVGGC